MQKARCTVGFLRSWTQRIGIGLNSFEYAFVEVSLHFALSDAIDPKRDVADRKGQQAGVWNFVSVTRVQLIF